MLFTLVTSLTLAVQSVPAVGNPQITAAARLDARQNVDPSLVGYLSTSGQSEFTTARSCDFPATLSTRGSYAQCCAPSAACNFYSVCSDGALQASATSVFCDQGYCNTGVIVTTIGATSGLSFLGCWPTEFGTAAFSLIQDIGTAPTASATGGSNASYSSSSDASATDSSSSASDVAAMSSTSETSSTSSAASNTSTGAATATGFPSLTGFVGVVAIAVAML